MRVIQRRSAQIIHLLYLVVQIFLTYKRRLNILHDTKRKFLSIIIIQSIQLKCLVPKSGSSGIPAINGIRIITAGTLREAVREGLPGSRQKPAEDDEAISELEL